MKLIAEPYRPSEHVKILPTIPENEAVDFNVPNFRRFSRENQALSMREPFVSNHMMRIKAHHNLTSLGGASSLNK